MITLEFPHLERLIDENQFDTIYHEHFSYFSLVTIERLAARHGLRYLTSSMFPTHGGSLRVYFAVRDAAHAKSPRWTPARHEREIGFEDIGSYARFSAQSSSQTKRSYCPF